MDYALSASQKQVVEHFEGPLLVNSSPGTGKQLATVKRLANIIRNHKGNFKILILTFTRIEAQQVKERIEQEFEKEHKEVSDRFFIGTIHQFSKEIVETRGDTLGLSTKEIILIDSNEIENILKNILTSDSSLGSFYQNSPLEKNDKLIRDVSFYISNQKKMLKQPKLIKEHENEDQKFFDSIYYEYDLFLKSQSLIDIDDLILLAYRIFNERASIKEIYQRIYKFACIFEAQDLTFASFELLRTLYPDKNSNIMFVGDKNQAIYSFRGSITSFMEEIENHYSPSIVNLTQNYRSSVEIISISQKLMPSSLNISANSAIKGEVILKEFENEYAEAIWIADNIMSLVESNHKKLIQQIQWDNIAVIARNRYILRSIEKQFLKRNIPFANRTFGNLESESTLMKVFELGMRLIINPQDQYYIEQFQSLLKFKSSSIDYKKSFESGKVLLNYFEKHVADNWKDTYKILLKSWALIWGTEIRFSDALHLLENYFVSSSQTQDIEVLNIIISDINLWRDYWVNYVSGAKEHNLLGFRNKVSSLSKVSSGGISLLTVHSSQGREFDVVYVIGLNEGIFPTNEETTNVDRNILYVAITRAKVLLYLSYTRSSIYSDNKKRIPSRFLREMGLL